MATEPGDRDAAPREGRWGLLGGMALLIIGGERVLNSLLMGLGSTSGRDRMFLGIILALGGGVLVGLAFVRDRHDGR